MPPTPVDADFAARVHASFERQAVMRTLGASLVEIVAGRAAIAMTHRPELAQQHGFLHAGIVSTALDSACGYAAFSLMPTDAAVLTIEFKVNLLAPRGVRPSASKVRWSRPAARSVSSTARPGSATDRTTS